MIQIWIQIFYFKNFNISYSSLLLVKTIPESKLEKLCPDSERWFSYLWTSLKTGEREKWKVKVKNLNKASRLKSFGGRIWILKTSTSAGSWGSNAWRFENKFLIFFLLSLSVNICMISNLRFTTGENYLPFHN